MTGFKRSRISMECISWRMVPRASVVPVRADVWEASVTSAPPLSSRRSRWDAMETGGAVFTDNDEWAALLKSYRIHGKGTGKYDNVRIGMNSRPGYYPGSDSAGKTAGI